MTLHLTTGHRSLRLTVTVAALLTTSVAHATPDAGPATPSVGLGLLFKNGHMEPLVLTAGPPRHLQEIDLLTRATTPTDRGLDPVVKAGELARLDWKGLTQVEELWVPEPTGTFMRQRYFRKARWMEAASTFSLTPLGANGRPVGPAITASAGAEATPAPSDDFFVRRFVARQIATGCPSQGSCAGAKSFTAEVLVQAREAQHASATAQVIPPTTRKLALRWSADRAHVRTVDVDVRPAAEAPFAYGFRPTLEVVKPPRGGLFRAGDEVTVRLGFEDGAGAPLAPGDVLPSLADFKDGGTESGLRYRTGTLGPWLYYAFKKSEGVLAVALMGPTDRIRLAHNVVQMQEFMAPPMHMASAATEGFTSMVNLYPPFTLEMAPPEAQKAPLPSTTTFKLPANAAPGTYLAVVKARREYRGEPLNRSAVLPLQVGTPTPTTWKPTTATCETCHHDTTSFASILHGLDDRRTCAGCHVAMFFEPDNALDIRVHAVHSRSARFPQGEGEDKKASCAVCHTAGAPAAPARGWLDAVAARAAKPEPAKK